MKFLSFYIIISCLTACGSYRYHPLITSEKAEDHYGEFQHFVVASGGHRSSEIAKEIMEKGGNIVDAAVAMSFALSVERPHSTGLGGGGFMLLHLKQFAEIQAVDFREMAPLKSHQKMYLDAKGNEIPRLSVDGEKSVAVPGMVHGLISIHQKWGKLSLKKILQPVIQLARNGFPVYEHLANAIKYREKILKQFNAFVFFHPNGERLKVGDLLLQTNLAKTLEVIAEQGINGFYSKKNIAAIIKSLNRKGMITAKDFNTYKVKFRKRLKTKLWNKDFISMPPPSSGGVHVLQILNILESIGKDQLGPFQSASSIHYMASAMELAFADRATYLGDPDFSPVPTEKLISKQYAKNLSLLIRDNKALNPNELPYKKILKNIKLPKESTETTHFSMMDSQGQTIASTQTINGFFGSGVYVPELGIILNNEMDDFATKVGAANIYGAIGGEPNLVQPKKRPLSSMSPTIILNQKRQGEMAIGSPSGTRIITCVAQSLVNHYIYGQSLKNAIAATRVHQQWKPEKLFIEKPFFKSEVMNELKSYGHNVEEKSVGCRVQGVMRKDGLLIGVADPRQFGKVAGF